jgi:UDP-3-O-[3-hydroxymyristoyl] N-acetylglucosamine deacetylase
MEGKILKQRTINKPILISGIGLHTGNKIQMQLKSAAVNTGIIFKRIDIKPNICIKATTENTIESDMSTVLVSKENKNVSICTIEHLMSALSILKIDNLIVEVNAAELPIMDGSSYPFIIKLDKSGTQIQNGLCQIIKVTERIRVEENDKFVEITPSKKLFYRYEIGWDHNVIKKSPSVVSFGGNKEYFIREISKARTFGFIKEVKYLQNKNLAKGASLKNTIGITATDVTNSKGLRYADEFVKHKLLDSIGDFYIGGKVIAHFNCYRAGHNLHNRALKKMFSEKKKWKYIK